jgi:hypothetical protein
MIEFIGNFGKGIPPTKVCARIIAPLGEASDVTTKCNRRPYQTMREKN